MPVLTHNQTAQACCWMPEEDNQEENLHTYMCHATRSRNSQAHYLSLGITLETRDNFAPPPHPSSESTDCARDTDHLASFVFEASTEIAQPFGLRYRADNSTHKHDAAPVGAGVPAKNSTRWLAPAAPVFAGTPAPAETLRDQSVMCCSMRPVYRAQTAEDLRTSSLHSAPPTPISSMKSARNTSSRA